MCSLKNKQRGGSGRRFRQAALPQTRTLIISKHDIPSLPSKSKSFFPQPRGNEINIPRETTRQLNIHLSKSQLPLAFIKYRFDL